MKTELPWKMKNSVLDNYLLSDEIISHIEESTKSNCMMNSDKMTPLIKGMLYSNPKEDEAIIELGTFQGRTAALMNYALRSMGYKNKVDCVDNFMYGKAHKEFWEKFNKDNGNVLFEMGTEQFLKEYTKNNIAFLIIDGDHSYEGCKADIINSVGFVRKGGVIYLDDYNGYTYPGVLTSVNELLRKNKTEYRLLDYCSLYILFEKL